MEGHGIPDRIPPSPENFPVRNRIIAGMPLGVVIVEGKRYSGSLIPARLAMEIWQRGIWGAGECDAGSELCAKPIDQTGSEVFGDKHRRFDILPSLKGP